MRSQIASKATGMKRLDVKKILRFAFSWIRDEKYSRLTAVFFTTEAIALIAPILFTILILAATIPLLESATSVKQANPQLQLPEAIAVKGTLDATVIPLIVQSLVLIAVVVLIVLLWDWFSDKEFVSTLYKILPVRVAAYLIPMLGDFIVLSISLVTLPHWVNLMNNPEIESDLFATLIAESPLYLLGALTALFSLVAALSWSFVGSFFLTAKISERLWGTKTQFLEINVGNIIAYIKFAFAYWFVVLLNILSPRVFYIQAASILLFIGAVIIGYYYPPLFNLIWIAFAIYVVTLLYNTIRLSIASAVRVLEGHSSREALAMSWDYTEGRTFSIASVLVGVYLLTAAAILLIYCLPWVLNFVATSFPIVSYIQLVMQKLADALSITVVLFVSTFAGIAIYAQLAATINERKNTISNE